MFRTINVAYGGDLETQVHVFVNGHLLVDSTLTNPLGAASYVTWNGYAVMEAGERLQISTTAPFQGVDLVAAGYQLTLP